MSQSSGRNVPKQVKSRLPRYYRHLRDLLNSGVYRISSRELAARMSLTASQIRQDLNCFGGFGQQGYGDNVKYLFSQIADILGVNDRLRAILIGAGPMGLALAAGHLFSARGISLIGWFDPDRQTPGPAFVDGVECPAYPAAALDDFLAGESVDIAVFALPDAMAEEYATRLSRAGLRGFWNFSGRELGNIDGIPVINTELGDSLLALSYEIRNSGGLRRPWPKENV